MKGTCYVCHNTSDFIVRGACPKHYDAHLPITGEPANTPNIAIDESRYDEHIGGDLSPRDIAKAARLRPEYRGNGVGKPWAEMSAIQQHCIITCAEEGDPASIAYLKAQMVKESAA